MHRHLDLINASCALNYISTILFQRLFQSNRDFHTSYDYSRYLEQLQSRYISSCNTATVDMQMFNLVYLFQLSRDYHTFRRKERYDTYEDFIMLTNEIPHLEMIVA